MRVRILSFLIVAACCVAQPAQSTRPLQTLPQSAGLGYRHVSPSAATVRVVLNRTVRFEAGKKVDWSKEGVGWSVRIEPGEILYHPKELIPISLHEFRLRAKEDRSWPVYALLMLTTVYRFDRAKSEWRIVADSDRHFAWTEGFILRDGDVIAISEPSKE